MQSAGHDDRAGGEHRPYPQTHRDFGDGSDPALQQEFKNKDEGHRSIPKIEIEPYEDLLAAAIREFEEETGLEPRGDFIELGAIQQKAGKIVHAWAFPGGWDEARLLQSNLFELEWPPRSGKIQRSPEMDRAGFFSIGNARQKLKEAQHPFLDRLVAAQARF